MIFCITIPNSPLPHCYTEHVCLVTRISHWMGSHSLLQGIFPTHGSNPGLLHYRLFLYQLSSRCLYNIALYSIGLYPHHQLHPQLGVVFALAFVSSFFLESFLHWSSVAYGCLRIRGVHLSVSYLFCLFILLMGVSRQEYWNGLPFPSSEDHVLSELSTMTHPSRVPLHGMVHSFMS